METALDTLVRDYAMGKTSWSVLRTKGHTDYLSVLAKLRELDLRPPMANDELQTASQDRLRQTLRGASSSSWSLAE